MKAVLVTNIPAPYRIPVYNLVARELGDDFHVIFCARNEPNRHWDLGSLDFNHTFLKENFHISKDAVVHRNREIIGLLRRLRPRVIITAGFSPTYLYAWAYSLFSGARHIPMTDAWKASESHLGFKHRAVRTLVYKTSSAFLGASKKSLQLYRDYGVADKHLYQSCLCIDNERFTCKTENELRPYHLMFAGQIIDRKIPDFFADVVRLVKERQQNVKVLVIGDGDRRQSFLDSLASAGAEVEYGGRVSQKDLPDWYSRAKLLLFTTNSDAWGIVANEAMASGTPVITTPNAGVADDLVEDGINGYVLEPTPSVWADKIVPILNDDGKLALLRNNAIESVKRFTFQDAAQGIISAVNNSSGTDH